MSLNCYTYKVEVTIAVLAENEEQAEQNLQRGQVISEVKTLQSTTEIK